MTKLKGIPEILTPALLKVLAEMGHGEDFVYFLILHSFFSIMIMIPALHPSHPHSHKYAPIHQTFTTRNISFNIFSLFKIFSIFFAILIHIH